PQFSGLSPKSLSDTDLLLQILQKSLFLQFLKRRYQISVTGAAGLHFLNGVLKFYDLSLFWKDCFFLWKVQFPEPDQLPVLQSGSQFCSHLDIGDLLQFISHKMSRISIAQYRVRR